MRGFYLRSATAGLFIVASLVACHGYSGVTPYSSTVSQNMPSAVSPDFTTQPAAAICKTTKGAGTWLEYFAAGTVKGTTFKLLPLKSGFASWATYKYVEVKATPTPKPTPTPNPTPTPKLLVEYFYYGTFAMKNKQTGCAYLIATKNGKPFKGAAYNAITDGFPNLKLKHFKTTRVEAGIVSALGISHLSAKGGSGSATLVTSKKKPYTTGSIVFVGRRVIRIPDDVQQLTQQLLQDGSSP